MTAQRAEFAERVTATDIAVPPPLVSVSQDREWCVVDVDGEWKKIRFHDYDEIYPIPGLYETLFYEILRCSSPKKIRTMLDRCLERAGVSPETLRAMDLGAGNGMVGAELSDLGVRHIVGIDLIPEARQAAWRDRADIYDDYLVADMTRLTESERERLRSFGFNCLICVAALGFGDIPPAAFAQAYNLIAPGGWVGFNIKSEFLSGASSSGFSELIERMIDDGRLTIDAREEYAHRMSTSGEPLPYTGFVGTKQRDVPEGWLVENGV